MCRMLPVLAAGVAGALMLVPSSAAAQKALVYCPAVDPTGCAGAAAALAATFPDGVDRGYDGANGTIDLGSADLSGYAVMLVPSLADDDAVQPYGRLRDPSIAARVRAAATGRVAVWSGTPDLGSSNRDKKDALIRNLAAWAAADAAVGRGMGLVALLDLSAGTAAPYAWLAAAAGVTVSAGDALDVYANVEVKTATGTAILSSGGLQLGYTSMALGSLVATGATVDATGGRTTNAVLVSFAGSAAGGAIATVTTDKEDYAPGETVIITGTGWEPGETVSMKLHEEPLVHGDRTLSAVADGEGRIYNDAFEPEEHDLGVRFVLTAVGQTSGRTAQTTFTDDRMVTAVTVNGGTSVTAAPGASISIEVTVATTPTGGGGDDWLSTSYLIGNTAPTAPNFTTTTCVNTPDHTSAGTFTESFTVAAPAAAGTYNLYVLAWRTAGCGNNASNLFTLANAVAVQAANQPPVADAGGPYTAAEGSAVALSGAAATDDGPAAALTYAWSYTAGAGADAGAVCSFSPSSAVLHPGVTCTDDGQFTLTLTVTDGGGASDSDDATLTVTNAVPTADAGGDYTGTEGAAVALNGSVQDPGSNDGHTWSWSYVGAGVDPGATCTFTSATAEDPSITCTDDGAFKVRLVVTDDDGAASTASEADLTIGNAAPLADAGGPYNGVEGSPVSLNGSATDAGANDTRIWSWEYVDGAGIDGGSCAFSDAGAEDPAVTCTDDGTVELTLTVTDDDGDSTTDTATLTLANADPVADAGGAGGAGDATGTYTGTEGSAVQLNGSVQDAGSNDTHAWSWAYLGTNVDPGATCSFSNPGTEDPTIACTDDGTVQLTLTITDDDGGSDSDQATLTLANAAPVASAGGPYSGTEGSPVTLAGSATDAGTNDALTYAWTADASGLGGGSCGFDDATKANAQITCTDDGTVQLTLTVTDDDGASDVETAALTLLNAAPVADAGGSYSGNEGSPVQLDGSATDAGANDTHVWSWTYVGTAVDPGATCTFSDPADPSPTVTCTDDGTVQLTLTVTDDDGGSDSDQATLTLANVAPIADAGGPYQADEGTGVQLAGSADDAGDNDDAHLTYLWAVDVTGIDANGACTFDDATRRDATVTCTDDGVFTLTLTVRDDDGGEHADQAQLEVLNADPVADAGGSYTGTEGSAVQLNGSVQDGGSNDTHTWSWAYVDGAGIDGGSCTFSDPTAEDPTVTCTDDGTVELTLTVTDDDGGTGSDAATLVLANAAPVADAGGGLGSTYSGIEGSAVQLNGSVQDAGSNDTHTWSWAYVGTNVDPGATCSFSSAAAEDPTITCTDDGTVQLTLTVTDDDGGSDTDNATLVLSNADPVASAGGPYAADEGQAVTITGAATDAGGNDVPGYAWSYTAGADVDAGASCSFGDPAAAITPVTCTDDGTYQLTLTVTDDDGGAGTSTATLSVTNVNPVLSAIAAPLDPVNISNPVTVSASFTDQGGNDGHTGSIDWGDGSVTPAAIAAGTAGGTHTYGMPGVYTIAMTVTDDDGGVSNTSVFQYVVVYDPNGGFVTGGGWIMSQPGMYLPDPSLGGKANFGFVSKYQKGADVPTGNTEFQFHAGDLNFRSTSYEWLVVQGKEKASYKGLGTVNGGGDFGFMLSVIDGGSSGDRFRIKIWDRANGDAVVYDNQVGAADDAAATTALGGGSIVVHTGGNGKVAAK